MNLKTAATLILTIFFCVLSLSMFAQVSNGGNGSSSTVIVSDSFNVGDSTDISDSVNLHLETFDFYAGGVHQLKYNAYKQNKCYFLYFWAKWGASCQMLERNVFTDPELVAFVNENYYAYKVDISSEDGYKLKEKYNVDEVPTIIIFNEASRRMETIKGTLEPSVLIEKLREKLPEINVTE